MSFTSDWLFPPDQSRDIVNALVANNAPVSYCNVQSACGHDAFLLPNELALYGEMVRAFLANLPPGQEPTPDKASAATGSPAARSANCRTRLFRAGARLRLGWASDYARVAWRIPGGDPRTNEYLSSAPAGLRPNRGMGAARGERAGSGLRVGRFAGAACARAIIAA